MKALRIIGLVISKLGLSIGVMCLLLSFSLDGFIKGSVTSVLTSNPATMEIFETSGIDSEKVYEILESEDVQELVEKYVNPFLDGSVDVSNIDIGYDLLTFVRENEEKIEAIVGEDIQIEEIENYIVTEEIDKVNETYKEAVKQVQEDVPNEVKQVASSIKFFFSDDFRNNLFIFCFVLLFLTALLQWSLYVWIRTLGNILTWCGALVVVFGSLGSILVSGMFGLTQAGITIDFSKELYIALGVFGAGVICLLVYSFINRMVIKKRLLNKTKKNSTNA